MATLATDRKARQQGADEPSDSMNEWSTTRHDSRSHMSYTARMTLSFAATAIMTTLVLVLVLGFVWQRQFNTYTRSNMQRLATSTAESLASQYEAAGVWTNDMLQSVGETASTSGDVGVQVYDANQNLLYDGTWSDINDIERDDQGIPTKKSVSKLISMAPTNEASTVSADITTSDGEVVGSVRMWAAGSEALLTSSDTNFRDSSYQAILLAALFAAVAATIIGAVVARSLSAPIKRITTTAQQIRNGDLTARTSVRGEDEIGQLGETVDAMAESVERDMKLEHRLTSDVAHELRTPLMAMLATVEAMQDDVLPRDDEHLAVVASEVQRLSRLVDAMLQLSRMENGTTPFNPAPTDVVELTGMLVSSQEQLFSDRGIKLSFSVAEADEAEEVPEIIADVDRDMINQAITNLLSNALRYTEEGGQVSVVVDQERSGHGDVLISVADTGMGIAKEDLSRVFGRFWRSEASRARASGGLGVGLAVTKQIVDRHHGIISVESEEGVGTTFTLHIPKEYRAVQSRRRASATINV